MRYSGGNDVAVIFCENTMLVSASVCKAAGVCVCVCLSVCVFKVVFMGVFIFVFAPPSCTHDPEQHDAGR